MRTRPPMPPEVAAAMAENRQDGWYYFWDEDGDEVDRKLIKECQPDDVAEQIAEEQWPAMDYPRHQEVWVTFGDQCRFFVVHAEEAVNFRVEEVGE